MLEILESVSSSRFVISKLDPEIFNLKIICLSNIDQKIFNFQWKHHFHPNSINWIGPSLIP